MNEGMNEGRRKKKEESGGGDDYVGDNKSDSSDRRTALSDAQL